MMAATRCIPEVAGTPLSETERGFLRRMLRQVNACGSRYDGWYIRLFLGGENRARERDLIVADVHTAPTDASGAPVGWVLHAGTGPLNTAVLTAEVPGVGPVAFVGPVLSYYERVTTGFERLTDAAWAALFETDAGEVPARPAWARLYLADREGRAYAGSLPSLGER